MADKKDYVALFFEMHPGFFEREYIRSIPENLVCEEMLLPLDAFDPAAYQRDFGPGVSFGLFHGSQDDLHAAVEKVVPPWVPL